MTTTGFAVSPAEPSDLPRVLELLRACGLPETGVEEGIGEFVVARAGGDAIACCGLEFYGVHGLLRSLAVDDRWRGHGVAARLVRSLVTRAEQCGLSSLYLLTTTAPEYLARFEFHVCSRDEAPPGILASWEFRAGCPDTAILMRRRLAPLEN